MISFLNTPFSCPCRSFFRRTHKDKPAKCRMWTVFKGNDSSGVPEGCVKKLADKGYLNSHVQYNARATNKYREKTVLAYLVNVYMNLPDKQFYLSRGLDVDEDMYSLSVLVQWIWRSAIRDGEDIYIYIPSRRMRELLINWINLLKIHLLNSAMKMSVERRRGKLVKVNPTLHIDGCAALLDALCVSIILRCQTIIVTNTMSTLSSRKETTLDRSLLNI